MIDAMKAVEDGMPVTAAARKHNVPTTTLRDRILSSYRVSTSLDPSVTHDDNTDVYKKRYEEGYDIYDEPYVRWLLVNHPDDVRNDWMKKLKDSQKGSRLSKRL